MKEKADLFKALSDPHRLIILKRLLAGETCSCTLVEGLPITQPTLSHHLKMLSDLGLTSTHKEGTWKKHLVNIEKIDELIDFLIELKTTQVTELGGCRVSIHQ